MRYVGLDPSSNRIGMSLVDSSRKLLARDTFSFKPKKGWDDKNMGEGLLWAVGFLASKLGEWRDRAIADEDPIELVAVELVAVTRNMDTVRKVAYFEAACMLAAAWAGLRVQQVRVTTARKSAFGKGLGGLSKEQAYERLVPLYGEMGLDEADATVLGLWARNHIEGEESE